MKKLITLIMVLIMTTSLIGCSSDAELNSTNVSNNETAAESTTKQTTESTKESSTDSKLTKEEAASKAEKYLLEEKSKEGTVSDITIDEVEESIYCTNWIVHMTYKLYNEDGESKNKCQCSIDKSTGRPTGRVIVPEYQIYQ